MSLLPYFVVAAILLAGAYWCITRALARPTKEDLLRNQAYNRQYHGYDDPD